jgi:hypothetical protein
VEAASTNWEQDLFVGQQPYVERQLAAGVARETVVRDLVGMGADAARAKFFVDRTAKEGGTSRRHVVYADARSLHAYVLWALAGAALALAAAAALVLGVGIGLGGMNLQEGVPSVRVVARIEAASLLPGVLVGVVLRRQLCPFPRVRPVIAGAAALAAILAIRLLTRVEILHETATDHAGRLSLLGSGRVWNTAPTSVYSEWSSRQVAPLVLWDVAFVGLAAFVAAVFSRHAAED